MKDSLCMGKCWETVRRDLWGTKGEWMRIWGVGMRGARGCAGQELVWWGMKVRYIGEWNWEWGLLARTVAWRWRRRALSSVIVGSAGRGEGWRTGGGSVGGAGPVCPTRTSPVTCGLAGLWEGEQRQRATGERERGRCRRGSGRWGPGCEREGGGGGGRRGVQTAADGWEWMSVGVWVGGLVVSIVGG